LGISQALPIRNIEIYRFATAVCIFSKGSGFGTGRGWTTAGARAGGDGGSGFFFSSIGETEKFAHPWSLFPPPDKGLGSAGGSLKSKSSIRGVKGLFY